MVVPSLSKRVSSLVKTPNFLSASEAVGIVKSGNMIYIHSTSAQPVLLKALADRGREDKSLKNVKLCHLHVEGHNPCEDTVVEGRGTYLPALLSDVPNLIRGPIPIDIAFLNVSPPDKHGFCSLGTETCSSIPAIQTSKILIAQINPHMPRTHGNSFIPFTAFDYVVDVSSDELAPLPEAEIPPTNGEASKIGKLLAEMIPDGSTIQAGIGAIPNSMMNYLKNHKNLGIHTEMFSDGLMELVKCGAVNNSLKSLVPHKSVTSFISGSKQLYDFVDDNPGIYVDDAGFTNSPFNIAKNDNVIAVNTAIEVDITGQVCADSVGTYMVSGVGGQLDFEYGAALSKGGMPIICLPSLSSKISESTIVPSLRPGAGVTTTRYHAHWIVTEYGAVDLWGADLVSRAKALISLAHPSKREDLVKAAYDRYKINILSI